MIGCHMRGCASVHDPLLISVELQVLEGSEQGRVQLLMRCAGVAGCRAVEELRVTVCGVGSGGAGS